MSMGDFRDEIGRRLPVDVIVTVIGGEQSARAILAGGGLVGTRSSATPPEGVNIEFVDWPFQLENPSVQAHVDAVADHQPRYAVAPDAEPGRSLDAVLDVAERLEPHAEHVIVVPKDVDPDAIPGRYRLGVPFRDGFDTDLIRNTFPDFRGRPVHILGGFPGDQLRLADRHDLDVRSVDTPKVLAWADKGRVWIGQTPSGDEVFDFVEAIEAEGAFTTGLPTGVDLVESRAARVTFSVRNIVQAWQERRVTVTRAVEPGRGPPPVPPEGSGLLGPADTFAEREAMRERFMRASEETELGRVKREEPVATLGEFDDGGCAALPDVIRDVIDRWGRDPCRINMGECAIFADAVADKVPEVVIVDNVEWTAQKEHPSFDVSFEHAFLECGGRYYDSETPDGVDDWRDLPFFRRNFSPADVEDAFVVTGNDSGWVVEPGVWMPEELPGVGDEERNLPEPPPWELVGEAGDPPKLTWLAIIGGRSGGRLTVTPTDGEFIVELASRQEASLGQYGFDEAIAVAEMVMDPIKFNGEVPDRALERYLTRVVGVPAQAAAALGDQFPNFSNLRTARERDLTAIFGVGADAAQAVLSFDPDSILIEPG